MRRGPQGLYGSKYYAEDDESIETSESFIYVNSEVAKMEFLPGCEPPENQTIGEPFQIQPKIRIYDYYNNYLQNKYVVAVSWPEPSIPTDQSIEGQNVFMDAVKFAYLSGDVSEPSNSEGVAEFKNLKVLSEFRFGFNKVKGDWKYFQLYIYPLCLRKRS